jgi:hypothetical protein
MATLPMVAANGTATDADLLATNTAMDSSVVA